MPCERGPFVSKAVPVHVSCCFFVVPFLAGSFECSLYLPINRILGGQIFPSSAPEKAGESLQR